MTSLCVDKEFYMTSLGYLDVGIDLSLRNCVIFKASACPDASNYASIGLTKVKINEKRYTVNFSKYTVSQQKYTVDLPKYIVYCKKAKIYCL